MTRAYTSTEARRIDQAAQNAGVAGFELMRRAGMAALQRIAEQFPAADSLLVLAGKGNNGGDAYVVAGAAKAGGWTVDLWQVAGAPRDLQGEAADARDWAYERGVAARSDGFSAASLTDDGHSKGTTVIVDGLLGTGLRAAPRDEVAQVIDAINASDLPCVALDVPSGINADNGAMPGVAVQAQLTVTFIGLKLGLLTGRGADRVGRLVLEPIGVQPERLAPELGCMVLNEPVTPLPARRPGAFKNQLGHVLALGGDSGSGGAVILAAEAALRVGAGLVSVGTREGHVAAALTRCPELMVRCPAGKLDALQLLKSASVAVVGPGLGQSAWGQQLFAAAVESGLPLVVDADALNLLAERTASDPLPGNWVMTPHPGEAGRLLGISSRAVEADRVSAVLALVERYRCIAVLKGAGTLIASPGPSCAELLAVCTLGNPGMASAGMGDTLAGIVAGVVAQQEMSPYWVGQAVQIHAAAGDRAAAKLGEASLLATDLIGSLPAALGAPVGNG